LQFFIVRSTRSPQAHVPNRQAHVPTRFPQSPIQKECEATVPTRFPQSLIEKECVQEEGALRRGAENALQQEPQLPLH
jgi:hypothetical protein